MGQACCTHKGIDNSTQLETREELNLHQADSSSSKYKEKMQRTDDSTLKIALPNETTNKENQEKSLIRHTLNDEKEEENYQQQEKNRSRIGNNGESSQIEIERLSKKKIEASSEKNMSKIAGASQLNINGESIKNLSESEKKPQKIMTEQETEGDDTHSKKTAKTAAAASGVDQQNKDIDFFMDFPRPPNLRDIHKEGSQHQKI